MIGFDWSWPTRMVFPSADHVGWFELASWTLEADLGRGAARPLPAWKMALVWGGP